MFILKKFHSIIHIFYFILYYILYLFNGHTLMRPWRNILAQKNIRKIDYSYSTAIHSYCNLCMYNKHTAVILYNLYHCHSFYVLRFATLMKLLANGLFIQDPFFYTSNKIIIKFNYVYHDNYHDTLLYFAKRKHWKKIYLTRVTIKLFWNGNNLLLPGFYTMYITYKDRKIYSKKICMYIV